MLVLTPERQLARVNVLDVLAQIERVGFFLQLPPPPIERAPSGVRADHLPQTTIADDTGSDNEHA